MLYVVTLIVALLLASAQSLWRVIAQRDGVSLHNIPKVIFTTHFIAGALLYVIATLLYLYLQSKYLFTHVQSVLLVGSLLISFTFAWLFFAEKISVINLLGVALLIIGIVLVVQK